MEQTPAIESIGTCDRFMDTQGRVGDYGLEVVSLLNRHLELQELLDDSVAQAYGMRELCPRFAEFNLVERMQFWIWTLGAIAFDESRCQANVERPDIRATGLLQLERDLHPTPRDPRDPRRGYFASRAWRGGLCVVSSVRDPRANIGCGLQIMHSLVTGRYGLPRRIAQRSYWQKLNAHPGRAAGNPLMRVIRRFPGCQQAVDSEMAQRN